MLVLASLELQEANAQWMRAKFSHSEPLAANTALEGLGWKPTVVYCQPPESQKTNTGQEVFDDLLIRYTLNG